VLSWARVLSWVRIEERKENAETNHHPPHTATIAILSSYHVRAIATLLPLTLHETLDEEQWKEALGNHRLAVREQVGAESCCVSASL
jgi:hypothetical protein